jgi:hypothetical protein
LAIPAVIGNVIDVITQNKPGMSFPMVVGTLGSVVVVGSIAAFVRISLLSIASERIMLVFIQLELV